ncbi:MAG: helix-turn-helix domain-containing protein [Clostridia bacterium]|nr:helix-turn-helix domain-containing protein [Clostridia bacterium]
MENTEHIGLKIAALRRAKGCTQAELGIHLSISPQAVSKWERGESCPDFETLCKIAAFFEVPISHFEKDAGELDGVEAKGATQAETGNEKKMLGVCKTCGRVVYEGEEGRTQPALYCKTCVEAEKRAALAREEKEKNEKRIKAAQRNAAIKRSRNRGFIWGGIIAVLICAFGIFCSVQAPKNEVFENIVIWIVLSGLVFLFTCQMFWDGAVFDCATTGGKIVGTPGIIFTFDLDGFIFLIAMKILFALIRFIFYILSLLFFVVIAFIIAPFTFVPALIRINKGDLVD